MRTFTAVVEKCPDTHLYVGYVPGFPGAHSQGATLDELNDNLKEVIEMLLDDAEPRADLTQKSKSTGVGGSFDIIAGRTKRAPLFSMTPFFLT